MSDHKANKMGILVLALYATGSLCFLASSLLSLFALIRHG